MELPIKRGFQVIKEMAAHNAQYGNPRGISNKGDKHEVSDVDLLSVQLTALSHKVDNLHSISSSSS